MDLAEFPNLEKMERLVGSLGKNCNDVCAEKAKKCDAAYLPVLNRRHETSMTRVFICCPVIDPMVFCSCGEMRKAFECKNNAEFECSKSWGHDQPIYIDSVT